MDNDDLDVTKGCEIVVSLSYDKDDLVLNELEHKPYILKSNNNILEIYAGVGVGVVTKDGLKPPKNYPAINPKPLEVLEKLFSTPKTYPLKPKTYFCTIGVTNGKEIAKQTANAKVGVLGGISILGTTGWVKPISATAYIDSIEQELNYAKVNDCKGVVFTLGNTAYKKAIQNSKFKIQNYYIVEVGNFVYDAISLANSLNIKNIVFICGIGKMTKVAQGFKNTHNRFGGIDLELLKDDIYQELDENIDINITKTVKGISLQLELNNKSKKFYNMIEDKANKQLKEWFNNINIKGHILEDIGNILKNNSKDN